MEETGLELETPAGVFRDCVRVVEEGRSIGNPKLTGGPDAGTSAHIEWRVTRWWAPGVGPVREETVKSIRTVRRPVQEILESVFEFEVVSIERR